MDDKSFLVEPKSFFLLSQTLATCSLNGQLSLAESFRSTFYLEPNRFTSKHSTVTVKQPLWSQTQFGSANFNGLSANDVDMCRLICCYIKCTRGYAIYVSMEANNLSLQEKHASDGKHGEQKQALDSSAAFEASNTPRLLRRQ
jgi:hypothetical protein